MFDFGNPGNEYTPMRLRDANWVEQRLLQEADCGASEETTDVLRGLIKAAFNALRKNPGALAFFLRQLV